jgi:hypothetical protein
MLNSGKLCFKIYRFSNYIILPLGIILNLICIVIFKKIIRSEPLNQKNNLFKYLFMKSICDFIYPTIMLGDYIYHKSDGSTDTTLIMQLWYTILSEYLVYSTITCSIYFDILATFDCFLMISKMFGFLKTFFCFKISTFFVVSLFFISYLPFIFYYKINRFIVINNNYNLTTREIAYNFTSSKDHNIAMYFGFVTILRDLVPITILIILNSLILVTLHKVTKQKVRMKNNLETFSIRYAMNAERNKVKMIFFTSLIYLFHLPLVYKWFKNLNEETCFSLLSTLSYRFSYAIAFFSYFLFNNNFRRYLYRSFNFINNRVHSSTNI